jgi:hypothetical protein
MLAQDARKTYKPSARASIEPFTECEMPDSVMILPTSLSLVGLISLYK